VHSTLVKILERMTYLSANAAWQLRLLLWILPNSVGSFERFLSNTLFQLKGLV
jgi:hypothetical protein